MANPKMARNIWLAVLGLVLIAIAYFAWQWYRSEDVMLSERPEQNASEMVIPPKESIIVADLSVKYAVLTKGLSSVAAGLGGQKKDTARIGCKKILGSEQCLDFDYTINYGSNGAVSSQQVGDKVGVSIPAQFSGQGGFNGDLADLLDLDNKSFAGAFVVTASSSATLNEKFCPVLAPGPATFRWTTPAYVELIGDSEIIGPYNWEVSPIVQPLLSAALNSELGKAANAIPCAPVQKELQKAWRHYAIPVTIAGQPPLFVNINPTAIGTSPLIAGADGLRLLVMLKAEAEISGKSGSTDAKPVLPTNQALTAQPGVFGLSLPIRLPYETLQSEITKAVKDKPFETKTEYGDVTIKIGHVELYPSGDRLTVGLSFAADVPHRIFDTKGTIWLSARPAVDPTGKILSLSDVTVSRQLDNPIWAGVTVLFKDTISKQIEQSARYDLTKDMGNAMDSVQKAVADPSKTGGMRFKIENLSAALVGVVPEKSDLAVEIELDGVWSAELEDIKL